MKHMHANVCFSHYHFQTSLQIFIMVSSKLGIINLCNIYISYVVKLFYCHLHLPRGIKLHPNIFCCVVSSCMSTKEGGNSAPTHCHSDDAVYTHPNRSINMSNDNDNEYWNFGIKDKRNKD